MTEKSTPNPVPIGRQWANNHVPNAWSTQHHTRLWRAEKGLEPLVNKPECTADGHIVGGDLNASRALDEALQRGKDRAR